MFRLIFLLAKHDYRTRYVGWMGVLGEMIAIGFELLIYWYTSKAFTLTAGVGNYFEFIVMGELALLIPSRIIDGALELIRNSKNSDFIETIVLSKYGLGRFVMKASFSGVMRELIRIVFYFTVLLLCFNIKFSFIGITEFFLIQFMYLPMFLCIAFIFNSALLFFGRGYGALNKILMVFVVFSGAYFPQTVLPEVLQVFVSKFIPYSAIVSSSRNAIIGIIDPSEFISYSFVFIIALVGCYFSSVMMDKVCMRQLRKDRKFVA